MQRLNPTVVQLYPQDENNLYPFLYHVTQEWQFLAEAWSWQTASVTEAEIAAAASERDFAVRLFNEWMNEAAGRHWFRVLERYEMPEDTWRRREMLLLAAGAQVLLAHCCEVVLAHIDSIDRTLFDSSGNEVFAGRSEAVQLHCLVARRKELMVLSLETVPSLSILNH